MKTQLFSQILKFSEIIALNAPDIGQHDQYMKDAVAEGNAFITEFEANRPTEDALHIHNDWLHSPEGQAVLLRLTHSIISNIDTYPADSVPGHDKRHVFKDLSAAFHILEEENFINDWRALLLVPSLLHDSGRLVEEQFVGLNAAGSDGGKLHAYLSFKMLQEMLDHEPLIPTDLKNEMLYAVLVHQSGKGQDRTMSWAVQRADREQLIGGELFPRILAADAGIYGTPLRTKFNPAALPSWSTEMTFLDGATVYQHTLYANQGQRGEARANDLKAIAIAGIQIASVGNGANLSPYTPLPEWRSDPFIHWVETGWKRPEVGEKVVPKARRILSNAQPLMGYVPPEDAASFMINIMEQPHTTLPKSVKDRLRASMDEVSPAGRISYVRSLILMQHYRAETDSQDLSLLNKIFNRENAPSFVRKLARDCASRMGQVETPAIIHHLEII